MSTAIAEKTIKIGQVVEPTHRCDGKFYAYVKTEVGQVCILVNGSSQLSGEYTIVDNERLVLEALAF
jgi:hypothetical protein